MVDVVSGREAWPACSGGAPNARRSDGMIAAVREVNAARWSCAARPGFRHGRRWWSTRWRRTSGWCGRWGSSQPNQGRRLSRRSLADALGACLSPWRVNGSAWLASAEVDQRGRAARREQPEDEHGDRCPQESRQLGARRDVGGTPRASRRAMRAIGLGRPDCFYRQPRAGSADASSHARRDGPPVRRVRRTPQVGLGLSPARALSHRCSRRAWRPSTDQFRDRPARRRGAARAREPFVREGHVERNLLIVRRPSRWRRSCGSALAGRVDSRGLALLPSPGKSGMPGRVGCCSLCLGATARRVDLRGLDALLVSEAEVPEIVASEDHRNTRWNCERSGRGYSRATPSVASGHLAHHCVDPLTARLDGLNIQTRPRERSIVHATDNHARHVQATSVLVRAAPAPFTP